MRPLTFAARGLVLVGFAAAAGVPSHAQDAPSFDVFYLEAATRRLELPELEALSFGRLVAAADAKFVERTTRLGDVARVRLSRHGAAGAAYTLELARSDWKMRNEGSTDGEADVAIARTRTHMRSRPRSHYSGGLAIFRAKGEPPPKDVDAAYVLRRLAETLTDAPRPPVDAGRLLALAPLAKMFPDDKARWGDAWRSRLHEVGDAKLGESPHLPALLALADAEAVGRLAAVDLESSDDEGEEMVVVEGPGGQVELEGGSHRLRRDNELPLSLAFLQTDDPDVRGAAGWMLYQDNPNRLFQRLAEDVEAGRSRLPGEGRVRAEREQLLRRGLKSRAIGPGVAGLLIGITATFALLYLLRVGLSRALFK
jgi:hypothetical protein